MEVVHKSSKIFDLASTTGNGSGNVVDIPFIQSKSEIITLLPINERAKQCPLALNQAKTSPSMSGDTHVQCVQMSATQ